MKTEDDIEPGRKVKIEADEAAEDSNRVKRQKLNADTTITVKADENLAVSDQKIKVEADEANAPLPKPQSRKNAASANAEKLTTDASSLPTLIFQQRTLGQYHRAQRDHNSRDRCHTTNSSSAWMARRGCRGSHLPTWTRGNSDRDGTDEATCSICIHHADPCKGRTDGADDSNFSTG